MKNLLISLPIFLVFLGCDKILYGEKTKYADGYSTWKFSKIQRGENLTNVLSQLGDPLWKTTQHWAEVWQYSKTPEMRRTSTGFEIDNFGPLMQVSFGTNGKVSSASLAIGGTNLFHLTRSEMRAKLGEPPIVEVKPFNLIFHYTTPDSPTGEWCTYKSRTVHFDSNLCVVTKISEVVYD